MFRVIFALIVSVGISSVHTQLQEVQCPTSDRPESIKVEISGLRNQTGHWFTQVGVQYKKVLEATENNRSSDEWNVGVEHSSVVCLDMELTTNIALTFSVPLPKSPPGYQLLPGLGFYKLHEALNTWSSARQICANEGGHLIVIRSEREAAAISKLIPADPGDAWVGIYEEGANGKYFTVFGDPATVNSTGYFTWFPGEPNDTSVGNCLLLSVHPRVGYGYNDYICGTKHKFVCKQ